MFPRMLPTNPPPQKSQAVEFLKVMAPIALAVIAAFQKSGPQF